MFKHKPLFIQMDIISLMEFSCYDSQQIRLIKPFTREDIKSLFFSLPYNKASVPWLYPKILYELLECGWRDNLFSGQLFQI
ncbi:hypothetical protein YC2023_084607 [Brassica napus]